MDKSNVIWKLNSNCTDVDCKKVIPNSDCFAGLCKCKVGYGASPDQRKCQKSKKFGSPCSILDACYLEKLSCDLRDNICQCAPGYRYDSAKNDCIWFYYCDDNLIWDMRSNSCVKPTDFWFPTTNHNPKLSFITFILLVFCFIKVMRSNSPYHERRRRISANINRNSFDFLSTIINYENSHRYPLRNNNSNNSRHPTRNHLRREGDEDNQEPYYDENPPAYEDIISDDLKQVTVDQTINSTNYPNNTNYLTDRLTEENIELKDLYQAKRAKLNQHLTNQPNEQINNNLPQLGNSQTNLNNNQIEIQSTSSETLSLENTTSSTSGVNKETVINNILNNQHLVNERLNDNLTDSMPSSNDQLNNQSDDNILPTYEQAISKMPPV